MACRQAHNFNWHIVINRLEGAYAPATLRSYRNDFSVFADWCATREVEPVPANAPLVAEFIENHARFASPATVKRRLAGIRKVHALFLQPDPTDDEYVRIALRRILRAKPIRPAQALGLTHERRDALMAACSDDLIGLRNRAMVSVGYDTLCRRSELVALRAEDLVARPRGGFSVLVRRAKNDPFGMGRTAWISRNGAATLNAWLLAAGIISGPMIRPVINGVVVDRFLNPCTVSRVLKKLAEEASLPREEVVRISGHSMRVGAAQDLMSAGRDILTIMRAGGWKSFNVVARYVESADLQIWD